MARFVAATLALVLVVGLAPASAGTPAAPGHPAKAKRKKPKRRCRIKVVRNGKRKVRKRVCTKPKPKPKPKKPSTAVPGGGGIPGVATVPPAATPGGGGDGGGGGGGGGGGPQPHGPGPDPQGLADAVTGASTFDQRRAAVLDVAKAGLIGVYDGNGDQRFGGAETGPDDLYLYTFELDSLAHQLGRGSADDVSFDQEAALFRALGLTLDDGEVTGQALEDAVAAGIQNLGDDTGDPTNELGLVVRDLAANHGLDLAHPPAPDQPVLDPLLRTLILIDIARPIVSANAAAQAADAAPAAAARDTCGGNFAGSGGGAIVAGRWGFGKWKSGPAEAVNFLLNGVHGTAIAYSFKVSAATPSLNTHFGHAGPQSGNPLNFKIKTEMQDDLSDTVIGCGTLAGYTVPGKGGVSGASITWSTSVVNQLDWMGTITCDAPCHNTDNDGIATLHFQPDDEYLPGQGTGIIEHGTITGTAFVQFKNGNLLGAILEALGVNKQAEFGWEVAYHDPGGYRINVPAITTSGTDDGGIHHTFTVTFTNQEACVPGPGHPHPLQPLPYVGLTPSPPPSTVNEHDHADSVPPTDDDNSGAPGAIPMGPAIGEFGTQPMEFGFSDNHIGPIQVDGRWLFDSPTIEAQVRAQRTGASPGFQSFDLGVSRASDCPLSSP